MAGRRRSWNGKLEEPVNLPPGPKQKTPKGTEIPVPKRRDVLAALKTASRPRGRKR